jgi:CP family cyanate transporter-like MFS transporter
VAFNLRTALVSVPAVAALLASDLGLSSAAIAALTALPIAAFAVFSLGAPWVVRTVGLDRTLRLTLVALAAGLALRGLGGAGLLFAGTALAGVAVALANVLLPGLARRDFGERAGLATGVYVTAFATGATVAGALTAPIAEAAGGWRPALAAWSLPAIAAVVVLFAARPRATAAPVVDGAVRPMARQPLAWALLVFLGAQSFVFFTVIAWLPALLQSHGYSAQAAGFYLSLSQLICIPAGFVFPQLVFRARRRAPFVLALVAATAAGLLGLLLSPTASPALWALLVGFGATAFPVGLTLVVLRSGSRSATDALSGFAQSGGYLLAAAGPLLAGMIHDASGEWDGAVLMLLLAVVPLAVSGAIAARSRAVL